MSPSVLHQPTRILAIDTSCDDTAAAVVCGRVVLSNVVASQTQLHKPYGGVYPTIAKIAHRQNWPRVVELALKRAQCQWSDLTAIAVTVGPGLAPALEVGIMAAKSLATEHHLPLIAINHVEAHAWSSQALTKPQNWFQLNSLEQQNVAKFGTVKFPVLAITVSGGHTQLLLIKAFGDYQILGQTLDDAAGECLDKVGRMLSLGYPAGPVVEQMARLGNPTKFKFPLPMTTHADFNLSYSGLKTHARDLITGLETQNQLDQQTTYDICASLQTGVFHHLTYKLIKLLDHWRITNKQPQLQAVWLGGGVAANSILRQTLRQTLKPFNLKLMVPFSHRLCGDNAAMIGLIGGLKFHHGLSQTQPDQLERQPRLALEITPIVSN